MTTPTQVGSFGPIEAANNAITATTSYFLINGDLEGRAVFIIVSFVDSNSSVADITGVTFDGISCVQEIAIKSYQGSRMNGAQIYSIDNASLPITAGDYNVVATANEAMAKFTFSVFEYKDCNSTTLISGTASASEFGASASLTPSPGAGDLQLGMQSYNNNATITPATLDAGTSISNTEYSNGVNYLGYLAASAVAGSIGWTTTADPKAETAVIIGINGAVASGVTLVVADVAHAQSLDQPNLVQQNTLAIAELLHAQALDTPMLTQANTLALADASHAHALDAVALAQANLLAVDAIAQTQLLDNIDLVLDEPAVPIVYGGVQTSLWALNKGSLSVAYDLLGLTIGDVVVVSVTTDYTFSIITQDVGHPGGITIYNASDNLVGQPRHRVDVIVFDGTWPATLDYVFDVADTETWLAYVTKWTGVDETNPIADSAGNYDGITINPTSPAMISPVDNAVAVAIYGAREDDFDANGTPAGYTKIVIDTSGGGTLACSGGVAYLEGVAAGAVDAAIWTQLVATEAHGSHVLLRPIAVASDILVVADVAHAHSLDQPDLVQQNTLAIAALLHAQALDAPTLTQANTLAMADTSHAHSLESPVLNVGALLVVAGALHSHTLGQPDLLQQHTLAIAGLLHGQTLDAPTLTQANTLALADASHAHSLESPLLNVGGSLLPDDIAHAQTLDAVALVQANLLAVDAIAHTQLLDHIDLTLAGVLTLQGIDHAHTLDGVALNVSAVLQVSDAAHAHALANVDLVQANVLEVLDLAHAQLLDSVELVSSSTLIVSDLLHAHVIDNLILFPGGIVTPDSRVIAIQADDRVIMIQAEDRVIVIATEDRIFSIQ